MGAQKASSQQSVCRVLFSARLLPFFGGDLAAMAEQQQFYVLLGNLMSSDNNVRKQAEVRRSSRFVPRLELRLNAQPSFADCPAARARTLEPTCDENPGNGRLRLTPDMLRSCAGDADSVLAPRVRDLVSPGGFRWGGTGETVPLVLISKSPS